jgi:hypothetical protein
MQQLIREQKNFTGMTFSQMSTPAKAVATCIILTLALGMLGALGQVIVHDIIPTFFDSGTSSEMGMSAAEHAGMVSEPTESNATSGRGDLFSEMSQTETKNEQAPFYKGEQFVWSLKWTHIHLFGMGMIFIFLGGISLLLDASARFRTWLIVLPFVGMWVDILAMWLKAFVSPVFFWLHMPGGGVFGLIFGYVSLRALWEMWIQPKAQT